MMGNLVGIVNVDSYACGDKLSTECMSKYIEDKSIHSQVFPTCGMERCKKFNTKLFKHKRTRKIDKTWKDEQRMKKRLRAMKLREEAVPNSDGMELDVDE